MLSGSAGRTRSGCCASGWASCAVVRGRSVQRTTYLPGELAQFDLWQPDVECARSWAGRQAVGDRRGLWVSRFSGGWMIPSRQAHESCRHLEVLASSGRCHGGWCGTRKGDRIVAGRQAGVQRRVPVYAELWASAQLCSAATEAKGLIERENGYFETSFLPGRCFESVADFNASSPAGCAGRTAHPRHHQGAPGRSDLRRPRLDAHLHAGAAGPDAALQCRLPGTTTCGSTPATTRSTRFIGRTSTCASPHRGSGDLRRHRSGPRSPAASPPTTLTWRARPDRPHHAHRTRQSPTASRGSRGATRPHRL